MRILHILSERGFSGGEDQLAHVIERLIESGHQNAFFLQPGAAFEATCERLHLPVHHVTMRNGVDLLAARKLRLVFGRVPCDLIHLADSRAHKLAGLATFGRKPPPSKKRPSIPRLHWPKHGKVSNKPRPKPPPPRKG